MQEWSSPGVARIAELVRRRTGLIFPDARVADVEAVIRRAMQRRNVKDAWAFADLLDHNAGVRDAMVAELTIGETYFQRDAAQFELLRKHVLPRLLERRVDRPVRVWSAGCASGEEPYSIAMLLADLEADDRAEIVGTDLSRPRLQDAQRAIYSPWSLRGMPEPVKRRFFVPRGRYYELRPELRAHVDFRYLNLAEDPFPSLSLGIWGMDLILCRNVLIYFDRPTVEAVARRLIASLGEDGYLILGASDPAIGELVACDVVVTDAGLIYRRPGAGAGAAGAARTTQPGRESGEDGEDGVAGAGGAAEIPGTPPWSLEPAETPGPAAPGTAPDEAAEEPWRTVPAAAEQAPAADAGAARSERGSDSVPAADLAVPERIAAAYERRDFAAVREAAARSAEAGQLDATGWAYWLRALANQGCFEEAESVAARGVEAAGPTAELLYLKSVLQLQAGRSHEAAATARLALYMDRSLVVAHLTLGEAQRQLGNLDGARRSLRNAGALLATLEPETPLPASDGETAGRLARLVRVKLRLIEEAA